MPGEFLAVDSSIDPLGMWDESSDVVEVAVDVSVETVEDRHSVIAIFVRVTLNQCAVIRRDRNRRLHLPVEHV